MAGLCEGGNEPPSSLKASKVGHGNQVFLEWLILCRYERERHAACDIPFRSGRKFAYDYFEMLALHKQYENMMVAMNDEAHFHIDGAVNR
ncbi:hypothetical protein ANN_12697 [Periplaneta americana]|uniref:Uncharacterized protein n=1 Tax=Periplaneta americana TaxID=6978 RepID=A0ABQ8TJA0_PERAM|nr:hypothetical protein ANN_12697 [Periplaneta americana]